MAVYDYLIIGGGMTAAEAVKAIRTVDPRGSIGLLSAEEFPPYNRPPLSKKLWQGRPEDRIWIKLPPDNLDLILNRRVVSLDPHQKQLQDDAGRTHGYKRLLLATGGSPRRLPFAPPEVLFYRTLADYRTARSWTGAGARIGIIGGGFIGSEIAAALATNHEQVVMVFPDAGIGARLFPADLARFVSDYYRQKGVQVLDGLEIQAIEARGGRLAMRARDGQTVEVDHIIAGIGILPNTDLAQAAGLTIAGPQAGGGILVDEYLRTSQADIFAAGDAVSFYNHALGQTMRVEHEDNALTMGKIAGLNLAGQASPYRHQPYFFSDLFDLGYEAVGELDSRLETFADWKEPFRQGVIYYLKDRRVRGVLLWNTWGQLDAARALIAAGETLTPADLAGRLPLPVQSTR